MVGHVIEFQLEIREIHSTARFSAFPFTPGHRADQRSLRILFCFFIPHAQQILFVQAQNDRWFSGVDSLTLRISQKPGSETLSSTIARDTKTTTMAVWRVSEPCFSLSLTLYIHPLPASWNKRLATFKPKYYWLETIFCSPKAKEDGLFEFGADSGFLTRRSLREWGIQIKDR